MADPLVVWSLIIQYGAGTERYLFLSRVVAKRQLYEYIKDCWDDAFPKTEIPEDIDDAIYAYFHGNELESYILVEEEVQEDIHRD